MELTILDLLMLGRAPRSSSCSITGDQGFPHTRILPYCTNSILVFPCRKPPLIKQEVAECHKLSLIPDSRKKMHPSWCCSSGVNSAYPLMWLLHVNSMSV